MFEIILFELKLFTINQQRKSINQYLVAQPRDSTTAGTALFRTWSMYFKHLALSTRSSQKVLIALINYGLVLGLT